MTPEKLGTAKLIEEATLSDDSKVLKVTGVPATNKTVTIFIRGSNQLVIKLTFIILWAMFPLKQVLDEADRSLHDALCVIRSLVKNKWFLKSTFNTLIIPRGLVCGGGAPEIEISQKLGEYARTLKGVDSLVVRAYAEALEIIPYTLAENAGLNPISVVTELRNKHAHGIKDAGVSMRKTGISEDMMKDNVLQPALVTQSALTLATECVRMILKIDDLVIFFFKFDRKA